MMLFSDSPSRLFWGGGIIGSSWSVVAFILSYWYDFPPGSSIVLVLGAVFLISFVLSPHYGVLHSLRRKRVHK